MFAGRWAAPANAHLAAGTNASFASSTGGAMFSWGKLKTSGDSQTHPLMMEDLCGWNVRAIACGASTYAVAADNSTITWGAASNGELGYGAGKKTSANPGKCQALEGLTTQAVAAGVGLTLFLVDPAAGGAAEKLKAMAVHAPAVEVEAAAAPAAAGAGGGDDDEEGGGSGKKGKGGAAKRKAPAAAAAAGGRGKKAAK